MTLVAAFTIISVLSLFLAVLPQNISAKASDDQSEFSDIQSEYSLTRESATDSENTYASKTRSQREALFRSNPWAYKNDIRYLDEFNGGTIANETINFDKKVEQSYYLPTLPPEYNSTMTTVQNGCAPVAGGIIVAFYDKYYASIIPSFTPGEYVNGYYRYYYPGFVNPAVNDLTNAKNMINTLAVMMNTNNPEPGTSQAQYIAGLQTYAASRSKAVSFTSVMSGTTISLSTLDTQLRSERIISAFCSTYNVINYLGEAANSTFLQKVNYPGFHIMNISGYKKVAYYTVTTKTVWKPTWYNPFNTETVTVETNFRTDTYLEVLTGSAVTPYGYMLLEKNVNVVDALSVRIY